MEFTSQHDANPGARSGALPTSAWAGFAAALRSGALPTSAWAGFAAALLLAAFLADYFTGSEVSSSLFYVIAVAVGAWFVGRRAGIAYALLGTAAWLIAFLLDGKPLSKPAILLWNLAVEMGTYLTVALAVARAHDGLEKERSLAVRLDRANRALEREALAVGRLQRELLPPPPPAIQGYEIEQYYATSTRAGGDYYDFFPLPDGRIGILVADASGHGAPAAVLMAMTRVLLHTSAEDLAPPDLVLERLNRQLGQTLPPGWFVTACYAVLDPKRGSFEYSLAGHDPPLLMRAASRGVEQLPSRGGPPLGPYSWLGFESGGSKLEAGDTLVLYTDGLTEAMSPKNELFELERVRSALEESRSLALTGVRERLLTRLDSHRAGAPLSDDLTLILLRRQGSSERNADSGDQRDREPDALRRTPALAEQNARE